MTIDEAITRYNNNAEHERTLGNLQGCLEFRQLAEWLEDYKRLLEQEPCEDAISREDALMCLTGEIKETDTIETIIARFVRRIRKLPPVTPQPKTGHWTNGDPICPCCGEDKFKDLDADIWSDWQPKYCPNCGAKMVEPQGSEG